ncbi:MAG: response regulator [Pseudomonadota bacterium]|nr:response regulator [Pseudomonadota bacterium]MDE3038181.1 response regulator [Pseudomonadota bacterium]
MKPITELDKPSILTTSTLFASINIVIADADHQMALLVKKLLMTLGCNRIFTVTESQEVLDLMKKEQVDMIITDWQMNDTGGLDLTRHLRQSLDSPNRMIPILMMTVRVDRQDIMVARDAGVTEYLVKPFSAKGLLERIHSMVAAPRGFVLCKAYTGPDRRRVSSLTLPPDPAENHRYYERKPPLIVSRDFLRQIILDDIPRMIMPDYTLKQKIGFEVPPELITNPLTVAQSEEEIKNAHENFMQSMASDVDKLERSYRLLIKSPDHAKKLVLAIQEAALSIKSRAGIFGYVRATEVAGQLHNFCRHHWDKENKYHLIILEKHIQTIAVIFARKIGDDGGEVGKELMKDLARLIHKYINRKG